MTTAGRALHVLATGPFASVQDAGRPGLAHLGVPRSGWLDAPAATLANRLVGNRGPEAVLECLLGGLHLRVTRAVTVAVTGADGPLRVSGRPVATGTAVSVPAGAEVVVGPPTRGLRRYLAVAGGLEVPAVLGSRSTDTLSGVGPSPLAVGDVLPVGPAVGAPSGAEALAPSWSRPVLLRVAPGPRADWFEGGLDALASSTAPTYAVRPESDRVGLRLDGPGLVRAPDRGGELPSEGVVLGAVQVPPDGRPLVFLADHPTTGGYPVVAVVLAQDLARCAQVRPGEPVRFRRAGPR